MRLSATLVGLLVCSALIAGDFPRHDLAAADPAPVPVPDTGPHAVITQLDGSDVPPVCKTGATLFLSADKAVADTVMWVITPPEVEGACQLFENGRKLVLVVGEHENLVYVHQIAIKDKVGNRKDVMISVRGNGPKPDPKPDPTPTPAPTTLSGIIAAAVQKVATDTNRSDFGEISNCYDAIAQMVIEGTITDAAKAQKSTDTMVKFRGGTALADWNEIVAGPLSEQLAALRSSGKLVTVADYGPVWKEIAAGIKSGLGPQPPPGPTPTPDPKPDPAPIAVDSLHVLIVYDEQARLNGTMPTSQIGILTSFPLTQALLAANAKYRIYEKNTPMATETEQAFKDAMQLPRQSLPWIIISNGANKGFSGPLPQTADETITLVNRFK